MSPAWRLRSCTSRASELSAFFDVDSTQDFKDSTQVTGEVDQGGLGLPDRDYYTRDDAKSKEQRAEYQKHVDQNV